MSVAGSWLVDFDWGSDGTWETIGVAFADDGSWSAGGSPPDGTSWVERDGLVLMVSIPEGGAHTVFTANRVADSMVGISSNTIGTFTGVWRARRVSHDTAESNGQSVAAARLLRSVE